MVIALTTDALLRKSVAGVARAVAIELAILAEGAGRASAAAAVHVGFIAVFSMVEALISVACERCTVAGVALAIGIDVTVQPEGASRTRAAAAVYVGFTAVLYVVLAG